MPGHPTPPSLHPCALWPGQRTVRCDAEKDGPSARLPCIHGQEQETFHLLSWEVTDVMVRECVYVNIGVCESACLCVGVSVCEHVRFVFKCASMNVRLCVRICGWVCMCVCMCVFTCAHVHECVYT